MDKKLIAGIRNLPTRKEAVLTLIQVAYRERRLKRDLAKTSVALMVLGLNDREVIEICHHLDLCREDGAPW